LPRPPIISIEEMGLIPLSEVSDTPPRPVSFSLDARLLAEVMRRIDEVLDEPRGLPNGKGKKRIKLTPDQTLMSGQQADRCQIACEGVEDPQIMRFFCLSMTLHWRWKGSV
jgi:hypothetical protein